MFNLNLFLNLLGSMKWLSGCWCLLPRLITRVPVLVTTYWKERTKSHCSPSDLNMHSMAYTCTYTNTSTQNEKRNKFIYFWYLTHPAKKKKRQIGNLAKEHFKSSFLFLMKWLIMYFFYCNICFLCVVIWGKFLFLQEQTPQLYFYPQLLFTFMP